VSAPHNELLREAAVMVTHCGHGTVIRSLAMGVPLVCMPMGRDQNDNAARVVFRGAGVRLAPTAAPEKIRDAVRTVIGTPAFRERAMALGNQIVQEARSSRAVPVLEEAALMSRTPAPAVQQRTG
jgi:UDP:flavonoid glycosyltransferase YjiC (YdhE family)